MSKKAIWIGVAILVIVGVSWFFLKLGQQTTLPEDTAKIGTVNTDNNTNMATAMPAGRQDSGKLQIEDIKVGTGSAVTAGDTVVMQYTGTLTNGTKFDSSYDHGKPFTTRIGVGQVIEGWDMGIPGMKVGGKRKLTIPPALGYGEHGAGGVIPPNATLIFEVELLEIK